MQPSHSSRLDWTGDTTLRRNGAPRTGPSDSALPELPAHLIMQRVLGEGGTSTVYEALHTRLKLTVAVKVLARLGQHEREAAERLMREAELCARLTDPRFPRIYDVDQLADGTPYIVMEHISGRSLSELIAHGPFDVETAWAITREVLEALMDIHALGIIHRDIKPGNILIESPTGREPRVRIVDFGIAKVTSLAAPSEALTEQGAMVGTPHYMAPEQMRGATLDERVDLYALGAVLYEMLAGTPAFDGATVGEVIAAALRDQPTPLSRVRSDVPPALEAFITKAMARDRRERFATAHEMLCALQAARVSPSSEPEQMLAPAHEPPPAAPPVHDEISGARPVTRPALLIVPEPFDALARPSQPRDTDYVPPRSRTRGLWHAVAIIPALLVPFWPTQLRDEARPLPVQATLVAPAQAQEAAQTVPGSATPPAPTPASPPVAAPPEAHAPTLSISPPQPIVIVPRDEGEREPARKARRRHGRERAERASEPSAERPAQVEAPPKVEPRSPGIEEVRPLPIPVNPY